MGAFFLGCGWYRLDVGIPALIGWGVTTRHPITPLYTIQQYLTTKKIYLQILI